LSKLGFSAVSGEASKMEGTLNKLTWVVEKITGGFDLMNRQLPIIGSGFEFLGKLMNPAATIMENYGNAVGWVADKYKELAGWIGKMGNVVPPQFQAAADAAYKSPAASKDAFDMSKGYRGKGYRDQRLPAIKDEQYGTPKPSGGGGADNAAREAEARKRAREESDAQLKAMQILFDEEQKIAKLQVDRIGLNKQETSNLIDQAQIKKTLILDLAKVSAEILKEKNKGADADPYIIKNLEEQKDLIVGNAIAQTKLNDERSKWMKLEKDATKSISDELKRLTSETEEFIKIDTSGPMTDAAKKNLTVQLEYLGKYREAFIKTIEDLKAIGEESGFASQAYLNAKDATESPDSPMAIASAALKTQKQAVLDLMAAEKLRSESFAGAGQMQWLKHRNHLNRQC